MNTKVIVLMLLCIAVIVTAGCTSGSPMSVQKSSAVPGVAYGSAGSNAARIGSDSSLSYAAEQGIAPVPAPTQAPVAGAGIETKIIRTADVTLEVNDVTGTVDSLKNLVTSKGGYVSSSSISEGYNNRLTGTIVLRVPQAEFENTLAGVKAIGTVKAVSTQGEDVTEQYVDLQAQKTSYQNQLAQYNAIMKRAENVSDVIEIQQQIDRVQTELDRLEGQLRYMNSRIDLSTITVNVQEPEPVGGESGHNFITTINQGIDGFLSTIEWLIVMVLTVLPFVILGLIAYGIYRWRKPKQPVAVQAPAAPAEKK